MSNLKLAVAVMDIGTTGVRILVGRITDKGTPKIIAKSEALASEPINILSLDLAQTELPDCVEKAVDTIFTKTGIEIKSCYVSLNNCLTRQVYNTGEIILVPPAPITGLDVGKVLNEASSVKLDEDEMIVDIVPLAYYADNELLKDKPEGVVCGRLSLEANAVIARADVCSNIMKVLASKNLKVDGFVPSFFASQKVFDSSSFFSSKSNECFTVIADVGGTVTDVSIYYNGIPILGDTIGVGGNNITRNIEIGFSVNTNQAARLKRDFSLAQRNAGGNVTLDRSDLDAEKSIETANLADIIRPSIADIAAKTQSAAGVIMTERGLSQSNISRYYFIGNGIVRFEGVDAILESVINTVDVEAIDKGKDLGITTSFTTALGMLIYISSKIKYGRRPSTVVNHNEADPQKPAEPVEAEDENFGSKVKKTFSKMGDSVKNFFEKFKS